MKGEELPKLEIYKDTLQILKISNNKISTLADLKPLKAFPRLIKLDLISNDICEIAGYREKVLEALPQL